MASLGEVLVSFHCLEREFSAQTVLFQDIFCLWTGDMQSMCHQMAPKIFHQRCSQRRHTFDRSFLFGCQIPLVVRTCRLDSWACLQKFSAVWGLESMTSNNCTDEKTEARKRWWLACILHPGEVKQENLGSCFHPLLVYKLTQPFHTLELKAAGVALWGFPGEGLRGRRKWG